MSRGSTGDIIFQGGRKLDLRDRSLSTQDVTALADLLSTRTSEVSTLILYNVRLNADVSERREGERTTTKCKMHCCLLC